MADATRHGRLAAVGSIPVVIPAAGRGSRLGSIGVAVPKELLPVIDRPALFHVLDEAACVSGRVRIVTRPATAPVLAEVIEAFQRSRTGTDELAIDWVIQPRPVGLGDSVSIGWVGDGAQLVLVPDEILGDDGALCRRMLAVHSRTGGSVLALRRVPFEELRAKGCATVVPALDLGPEAVRITALAEKPTNPSPGALAVLGRYVLSSQIQARLHNLAPGRLGEAQLSEALDAARADPDCDLYGVVHDGPWHDLGTSESYLDSVLELAVRRVN